jgi:hypothetical protein
VPTEPTVKCPWPKSQVKIFVKDAIDRMGGKRAFDFVGPMVQRAIICEACWRIIASQHGAFTLEAGVTQAIERAFCEAAGIWGDED